MDRAEAIEYLEQLHAQSLMSTRYPYYTECQQEAMRMAIAALREQKQREQGCEWCYVLPNPKEPMQLGQLLPYACAEHTYVGDGAPHKQRMKFCPMCGRKLVEQTK